jgi:hypothetical protein
MAIVRLPRFVPLLIVITGVLACSGCLGSVIPHPDVIYPRIGPIVAGMPDMAVNYGWKFEGKEESAAFSVNGSVYTAAVHANKNATLYKDLPESEWMQGYYRAFIDDPAQEDLFRDLGDELREIRERDSLDDSRYLELMMVFVQTIPYRTDPDQTLPKFPVETVVDRKGDCDDKSLLLAGLLAHEGYNVSILYFTPEKHAAIGIGCDGPGFRGTGYLFVETTNLSYLGTPPGTLADGTVLASLPMVIPVARGTRGFHAIDEVMYIESRLTAATDTLKTLDTDLTRMRRELDSARHGGRIREYNALVDAYNGRLADYQNAATVHDYIILHRYDRTGTYAWLQAHP